MNCLHGRTQRVVVNSPMSKWRWMTTGVPQVSVFGAVLFKIFLGDGDSGIECTLSKFADDTNLRGVVNMSEGWEAIQRDLDRHELPRFNKSKCKVQYLGQGNLKHRYKFGRE